MDKNMDIETANRVIAEYMGMEEIVLDEGKPHEERFFKIPCYSCAGGDEYGTEYYKSLDALVPVWKKLAMPRIMEIDISGKGKPLFSYRYFAQLGYSHSAEGETIQQAACIATAKCIIELKENNNE